MSSELVEQTYLAAGTFGSIYVCMYVFGCRVWQALIATEPRLKPFESITGFQVVSLPGGKYVTFEGNGRREALKRAFSDDPDLEVRELA